MAVVSMNSMGKLIISQMPLGNQKKQTVLETKRDYMEQVTLMGYLIHGGAS
jgi:hypothetical protein